MSLKTTEKTTKKKVSENGEPNNNNKHEQSDAKLNKGLLTNAVNTLFKRKEDYSHIRTYCPSNAFPSYKTLLKLISRMWDHRPELKGFKFIKKYNKLCFYQSNDNPKIILVGIKDTDSTSLREVYTAICNTIIKIDLRKLNRYINDLKDIKEFQKNYPINEYYYIATGISIAGAISDLFLEAGYIDEAITFNAVIEDRFISNPNIKNYRIYLDEDAFYLAMGKFAPNTKVYNMNNEKKQFINPIDEFNYLHNLHTLNSQKSTSLTFFKKTLKMDKTEDYNNVKEDWKKLFNKRLKKTF
jgi:hypothetical protein